MYLDSSGGGRGGKGCAVGSCAQVKALSGRKKLERGDLTSHQKYRESHACGEKLNWEKGGTRLKKKINTKGVQTAIAITCNRDRTGDTVARKRGRSKKYIYVEKRGALGGIVCVAVLRAGSGGKTRASDLGRGGHCISTKRNSRG